SSSCRAGRSSLARATNRRAADSLDRSPARRRRQRMQPGRVHGKVALVTGAGSGIGRAIAALLASEGATALVADVNEPAARAGAAEIASAGGKAEPLHLDVPD